MTSHSYDVKPIPFLSVFITQWRYIAMTSNQSRPFISPTQWRHIAYDVSNQSHPFILPLSDVTSTMIVKPIPSLHFTTQWRHITTAQEINMFNNRKKRTSDCIVAVVLLCRLMYRLGPVGRRDWNKWTNRDGATLLGCQRGVKISEYFYSNLDFYFISSKEKRPDVDCPL